MASGFSTPRGEDQFQRLKGIDDGDPAMQAVLHFIKRAAITNSTVLITGETGTGKELVARAIHGLSGRRDSPFASVNCASLPEALIENELFGHVNGAYTGANGSAKGKFEHARGGTLFLDEVGEMPLSSQPKLLRVLQDKTFERLGSNESITTDVRIIAATNRPLEEAIDQKRFREDLYYRLNVLPVHVPPLRERKSDIARLARDFLRNFSGQANRKMQFSAAALECLTQYKWPGNVRELENIVERLVILHDGDVIDRKDLPKEVLAEKPVVVPVTRKDRRSVTEPVVEAKAPSSEPYPFDTYDLTGVPKTLEAATHEIAREVIRRAMADVDGYTTRAAALIDTDCATLKGYFGLHNANLAPPPVDTNVPAENVYMFYPAKDGVRKTLRESVEEVGGEVVRRALARNNSNQTKASGELGVSRKVIRRFGGVSPIRQTWKQTPHPTG